MSHHHGRQRALYDHPLLPVGRIWRTTFPDGTRVTNEYYRTGLLKKTYGSRVHPVEYTYDAQGRIETMTTWRDSYSGSGAAVTTWEYHPTRGFLTAKRDAAGQGPTYSHDLTGRVTLTTWA